MEQLGQKKLELLDFQKELNEKFEQALKDEEHITKTQELVLRETCKGLTFIIPIHQLEQITSENKVEAVPLASNWIAGFNQVRGEVFTVVDFSKLIDYFLTESYPENKWGKSLDSNIVYIKNDDASNLALMLNSLSLKTMTVYQSVFEIIKEEKTFTISKINKDELEQNIKNHPAIIDIEKFSKKTMATDTTSPEIVNLVVHLADKVLWDEKYQRPIIKLDMKKLSFFLNNLSTY